MTKRVLFVGAQRSQYERLMSEAAALGLGWSVGHAHDAREAAERVAAAPPEVVLIQAPPARGELRSLSQLLRRDYPATACVVIESRATSMSAEPPGTLQAVPFGCDTATLAGHVGRSASLQALLSDPAARSAATGLEQLPSVPSTYLAITDAAQRSDTGVGDIARIIQSDPAMSLKVLQLVNSAYFGLARRTSSITEAVALLGVEQLKGLVLVSHVFGALAKGEPKGFSLEVFQSYSVRTGRLAKAFVGDRRVGEAAFTAGLLHDVGKVVLALRDRERYAQVVARETQGEACEAAERAVFGVTHSAVGAHLLASWEIPYPIIEAVAFHHEPSTLGPVGAPLLAAVHAAETLIGIVGCGEPEERLDVGFIERSGFEGRLPEWRKRVEAECEL